MNNSIFTFIGHGSLKFITTKGKVIYVDPFFPGDYSEKADILLITHFHDDHTAVDKITKADGCVTITAKTAHIADEYKACNVGEIKITAVEAYNENHNSAECVGFVLEFDGMKIYCAGDTSKTNDMQTKLAAMKLDYAILPIDGIYNMNAEEASECAKILNVRHAIPVHNDPKSTETLEYYDTNLCDFHHVGKIVLKAGEQLLLK